LSCKTAVKLVTWWKYTGFTDHYISHRADYLLAYTKCKDTETCSV